MGPWSRILLISVVMMLLAQPLFMVPTVAQKYPPGISIDDPKPDWYTFMAPTTSDTPVKFYTNVSILDPDGRTIDVQMKAILAPNYTAWSVVVSPASMTVSSTGKRAIVVTVVVPKGIMEGTDVQVYIMAQASYPNDTMEADTYGRIEVTAKFSLEWSHYFTRRTQYENRVTFNITNRGTSYDAARLEIENVPYNGWSNFEFSFSPAEVSLSPNETKQIELSVTYSGSSFPKELVVWVRLISIYAEGHGQHPWYWETNITVTFRAPDKTQQNYLFAGVISAAVIIMVVVMAAVVFGIGKKKS